MLRVNSKMKLVLEQTAIRKSENKQLSHVSKKGFRKKRGCFLLNELYQPHFDRYPVSQFHDETGFEAFTNSVHLRDYSSGAFLGVGLGFIDQVFTEFDAAFFNRRLKATFSLLNDDGVVKFYVARAGQEYLSDDIEGYDTAILEADRVGLAELNLNLYSST